MRSARWGGNTVAKISIEAEVPDGLLQEWLQHLRNFDTKHPGCHFVIAAKSGKTMGEAMDMIRSIDPPFDFEAMAKGPKQ